MVLDHPPFYGVGFRRLMPPLKAKAPGIIAAREFQAAAGMTDDLGREAMKMIRRAGGGHQSNMPHENLRMQLGIPVAAGVLYPFFGILLSPMIAAAAMSFSSVSVIGNALRVRRPQL